MNLNLEMKSILDKITDVDGDIVELGVYTGNNSVEFMLQVPSRKYFGFDTFCGYTNEDIEYPVNENKEGLIDNEGRWNHSKEKVISRIEEYKETFSLNTEYEIVEGDLKRTVPLHVKNKKIRNVALLYVDCNAYLPAIRGIEAIYPILSEGGIICIDEHQVGGETKAIEKTAEKYGLDIIDTGFKFVSGPHSNPSKYIVKK